MPQPAVDKGDISSLSRRSLLRLGGLAAVGFGAAMVPRPLLSQTGTVLEVAYAGSMGSLMEGPLKQAVRRSLGVELHGRGQGANALAQLIAAGSLSADVFLPITSGPMQTVLRAGKAEMAQAVARTEMVIAYSPKSRFAPQLDAAANGRGDWWKILQEPGFRFGRSDPAADPQGRNIIFTMMLAAKKYNQPDLVEKILGATINPQQISLESSVQSRLQSGELDAASSYRIQPGPFHLPYLSLPEDINLSGEHVHAQHPDVNLSIAGKSFLPEPLIYYAAALKTARNAQGAATFIKWLQGNEAQALFKQYAYDPPGDAAALHA